MPVIVAFVFNLLLGYAHGLPATGGTSTISQKHARLLELGRARTSAAEVFKRMQALLEKNELFLMMFAGHIPPEQQSHFIDGHRILGDAVAAHLAENLAFFEIDFAGRHRIDLDQVSFEMDVLIELTRLRMQAPTSADLRNMLLLMKESLGWTFQKELVEELARRSPFIPASKDNAIWRPAYAALTKHLHEALDDVARPTLSRGKRPILRDWISRRSPLTAPPMDHSPRKPVLVHPASIRPLLVQQNGARSGCDLLLIGVVDPVGRSNSRLAQPIDHVDQQAPIDGLGYVIGKAPF